MGISNIGSGIQPGVCTSTTRPQAPYEGQVIYETDTDKVLVWNGSAWYPNWNLPWGYIGFATKTATQGSITTETDVTGLSINFTAIANRRYKITTEGMIRSSVAGDSFNWIITRDSTNLTFKSFTTTPINVAVFSGISYIDTPSAGSVTYKVRAARNVGTGTGTVQADTGYANFILVEDIGPA
jgi:hypothetical protein